MSHVIFLSKREPTDSNDYLVLPSSPDIPADIYLLLSSFPGTHKIIEHLHGRVDDVLHCEWDLHLHHQPLVPGQVGLVRCVLPLIYFIINTLIIMRGLNKYFLIRTLLLNALNIHRKPVEIELLSCSRNISHNLKFYGVEMCNC